jgi:anti-anti-sigma regulatory factor
MIVESYEDVIVLSGALRSNFWETIHTAISLLLKRHPSGVIIDCSGITECTADGAETFRDAMEYIEDHDARIIVAAVPKAIMEVIKSVPHVRSQLAVAPSVDVARKSLDLLVEDEEGKTKKKPQSSLPKILVCLATGTGDESDDAAMRLASLLATAVGTEIILVCVLIVPRELPLQAPLAKQEESTGRAIGRAHAFYDGKNQLYEARVERGRDIASTLAGVMDEVAVSHVVLPLNDDEKESEGNARLIKSVLGKLNSEVVFVRNAT